MTDPVFDCPKCGHSLSAMTDNAGKVLWQQVVCPKCKTYAIPPRNLRSGGSDPEVPKREWSPPPYAPIKPAPEPAAAATKACKYCGEEILLAAIKCKHCGEFVEGHRPKAPTPNVITQPREKYVYVTTQQTFKRYKITKLIAQWLFLAGFALPWTPLTLVGTIVAWFFALLFYGYAHFGKWYHNE